VLQQPESRALRISPWLWHKSSIVILLTGKISFQCNGKCLIQAEAMFQYHIAVSIYFLYEMRHPSYMWTDCTCWSGGNALGLCLVGAGSKSWPGHSLDFMLFVFVFSPSRQILRYYPPQSGQYCFLPHPFLSISHSTIWHYIVLLLKSPNPQKYEGHPQNKVLNEFSQWKTCLLALNNTFWKA
jgi:hypothetical protein